MAKNFSVCESLLCPEIFENQVSLLSFPLQPITKKVKFMSAIKYTGRDEIRSMTSISSKLGQKTKLTNMKIFTNSTASLSIKSPAMNQLKFYQFYSTQNNSKKNFNQIRKK